MAIRLVAFDLDDTLLRDDQTISQRNIETVQRAQRAGIYVTAATGRMYPSALPFCKQLGITTPILLCQGAQLIDPVSGKEWYRREISVEQAHAIIALAEENGVYVQTYAEDGIRFAHECEESRLYSRISAVPGKAVGDLTAYTTEPTVKMLCIGENKKLVELWDKAKERFGDTLEIAISKPFYLEFTHPRANKGEALLALGEMLGVAQPEIMAIGDSHNDMSMLRAAGVSVAVGNAPDVIKEQCTYVVGTNMEDGVAEAIEKWVLCD